ncbi:MAG: arsenite oxidase small subunit [Arenicella sp.]|jgi:arsenite oxidase small subunit
MELDQKKGLLPACLTRRGFLIAGGTVAALPALSSAAGVTVSAKKRSYPRKKIALLSDIENDVPVSFRYPYDDEIYCNSFIIKLGSEAGGGVGNGNDIVAFNSFCPHMGGPLMGVYNKEHKVAGPCPLHLSTFDLTRHGMLISGHATESLPQVILEISEGSVYGVGMMGLIYGFNDNLNSAGREA